jgi:hypothetical protein
MMTMVGEETLEWRFRGPRLHVSNSQPIEESGSPDEAERNPGTKATAASKPPDCASLHPGYETSLEWQITIPPRKSARVVERTFRPQRGRGECRVSSAPAASCAKVVW